MLLKIPTGTTTISGAVDNNSRIVVPQAGQNSYFTSLPSSLILV
ncbi:conserved hypothetical protein [Vibrio parahaemolyticus Peru-466]|nr:conserved hypothetical protein [Vibrio parahaemolyticus Peru-466]